MWGYEHKHSFLLPFHEALLGIFLISNAWHVDSPMMMGAGRPGGCKVGQWTAWKTHS